jgi:hypothetical protein
MSLLSSSRLPSESITIIPEMLELILYALNLPTKNFSKPDVFLQVGWHSAWRKIEVIAFRIYL